LTYAPVFSFIASDNIKYTLISNYNRQKKYNVGDTVKVYYPNDKPKSAILQDYFSYKMYLILAILGFIGSTMLVYYLKFPLDGKY